MTTKEQQELDPRDQDGNNSGDAKPIEVTTGMLGFFATSGDEGAIPTKVVGPQDVDLSPDEIITPPDGGWGWFIVFIAFLSNMIVDGTIFAFGFIQMEIEVLYRAEEKPESEVSSVAFAGSLILGFNFLSGPITSTLADKFGFRAVSMAGSWIAGIAFVIAGCSALDNGLPYLPMLFVFYGVIAGLATGMIYMPSVVCVGYYFDKKRALAVGLAISGTGCGCFVMGILTQKLIWEMGWQGTLLVQGCILFSCSMIGALYRPLEVDYYGDDCFKDLTKMSKRMRVAMADLAKREAASLKESRAGLLKDGEKGSVTSVRKRMNLNLDNLGPGRRTNLGSSAGSAGDFQEMESGQIRQGSENGFGVTFDEDESEVPVIKLPSRSDVNKPTKRPEAYVGGRTPREREGVKYVYTATKKNKRHAAPASSGSELRLRSSNQTRSSNMSTQETQQSIEQMSDTMATDFEPKRLSVMKRIIRKLRSFRITAMPAFWIIAINGFLLTLGYPIPYMYLSRLAMDKGVKDYVALNMLSFLGMANTIGRILCGYFSDWPQVNSLYVNNISGIIAGVLTCVVPLFNVEGDAAIGIYIVYAILYGSTMACFATLRSILIRDYIGFSVLAQAFGLCLSFQGVAAIASSPMAEALCDASGKHYTLPFIVSGGLVIAGSALTFLLPFARKLQTVWDAQREEEEDRLNRKRH